MNRRDFLIAAAAATSAAPIAAQQAAGSMGSSASSSQYLRWTMFSRHLQWVTTQAYAREFPYETGVMVGEAAAEAGFGAVDLTVRGGGHIEPEVVRTNLAPMLRGVRSTGTHCDHITSGILNMQSDYVREVLTTAAENGIKRYRWGTFSYEYSAAAYGPGLVAQLDQFRRETAELADFNASLGLTAIYHTYSGNRVAASLWDLMYVLNGLDPNTVAINYDIGHMTSEGLRSWVNDLRYAMPYVRSAGLKDSTLVSGEDGQARSRWMAAGAGTVDWVEFFRLLREGGFSGPAESQLEFDYLGTNLNSTWWSDSPTFTLTRQQMIDVMKSELATYRAMAIEGGWDASQLI